MMYDRGLTLTVLIIASLSVAGMRHHVLGPIRFISQWVVWRKQILSAYTDSALVIIVLAQGLISI